MCKYYVALPFPFSHHTTAVNLIYLQTVAWERGFHLKLKIFLEKWVAVQ